MEGFGRGVLLGIYLGVLGGFLWKKYNDRLSGIEGRLPAQTFPAFKLSPEREEQMREASREGVRRFAEDLRAEGLVISEAA